ncbi:MAG: sulfotransferase domain-containing protein [Anaerolineales bacterium]|nr:sulfotransferase domain-containing protein [Anaerolineales bacterium]
MKQSFKNKIWLASRYGSRLLRNVIDGREQRKGLPIIFSNSFPKSGTNLMRQVFQAWAGLSGYIDWSRDVIPTFENDTGRKRSDQEILQDLHKMQPGEIWSGHLFHTRDLADRLLKPEIVNYFIYRDPRDVVVSHAFYVTNMALDHVHHEYYQNVLHTDEERITTSILGLPESDVEFPGIAERYKPYLGWVNAMGVLSIKFEDLIKDRENTLRRILQHFLAAAGTQEHSEEKWLERIHTSIQPSRSPTYREGKTGGWRNHFTEEHKNLFKEKAGALLVELGYETDQDW